MRKKKKKKIKKEKEGKGNKLLHLSGQIRRKRYNKYAYNKFPIQKGNTNCPETKSNEKEGRRK